MFTIEKTIILYIIEKCNSMLSCTHHNDLQYNIVVMKASIKPWRQVWSQDSREKLKKWWSLYIELLTEFCGNPYERYAQISLFEKRRHNNLATQLYKSFNQRSPSKNILSSLQTLIPSPLWLNFCPLSVVSSNFSHDTHVSSFG